jgi:hypothetical protein
MGLCVGKPHVRAQKLINSRIEKNQAGPICSGPLSTIIPIWRDIKLPMHAVGKWNLVIWDLEAENVIIDLYNAYDPTADKRFRHSDNMENPKTVMKYTV